jgi:hypothetical protein
MQRDIRSFFKDASTPSSSTPPSAASKTREPVEPSVAISSLLNTRALAKEAGVANSKIIQSGLIAILRGKNCRLQEDVHFRMVLRGQGPSLPGADSRAMSDVYFNQEGFDNMVLYHAPGRWTSKYEAEFTEDFDEIYEDCCNGQHPTVVQHWKHTLSEYLTDNKNENVDYVKHPATRPIRIRCTPGCRTDMTAKYKNRPLRSDEDKLRFLHPPT